MLARSRLVVHLVAVVVVLGAFSLVVSSTAWSLPLYLGNVGNFQIRADTIEGRDFDLALAVDDNSGESGGPLPVGELAFDEATIDGLLLEKRVDLSTILGSSAADRYRLSISAAEPVEASGLRVNAAGLCADLVSFGPGFQVDGKGAGTETPLDDLSLGASTIRLVQPGVEATYLTSDAISLSGVRIVVQEGDYDLAPCAREGS